MTAAARELASSRCHETKDEPAGEAAGTCAGPYCGRPIKRAATGRPARYCSANCRQDAKRARDRARAEAAELAEALRHARNTVEDTGAGLAETVHGRFVPQRIAEAYAAAVDPARPNAELDQALDALALEVSILAALAREHRAAVDQVRDLEARG